MNGLTRHIGKVFLLLLLTNFAVAQTNYTLQKAIQTARTNNPVLKSQQYNIAISEADIITAKLRPNPVLNNQSLQLAQPSLFPANTDWSNGQNRQVWWQLTKPFQLPAQRKNKIDFATKNKILTENLFFETERSLFLDVASKWLDVWTAQKQLDIIQAAKSNIDSLLSINRLRYKNQIITQTDLTRTELLASQYELQIKSAQQNYRNEITNLKFLIGIQDSISVETSDNLSFILPASVDSFLNSALANRTDILAIKSTIDVANSNIKLQKSFALPQPELGMIYNPQNTIPYVGFYGTIEIPIFSRNQGEIKKSTLLKQQAEQNLNAVQLQIQTEISTAYFTYQVEKQNLEKFAGIIKQSEEILNNVKYTYLHGGTTIIDFLEAQRSWLDTQQQYYGTIQQYRQSYIKLLYASGLINQLAK